MIHKVLAEKDKQKWLEQRSKSIGGSEAGTILGFNPFQSAYGLWAQRTGMIPAFEGNMPTKVGTALEPFVADLFTEETGLKVKRTNYIWYNDSYPHQHASPDRLIAGEQAGLEIKTTSAWNSQKFKGGQFPLQYYAQCVQYMSILEYPVWYLAVLVGNTSLHIYMLRDSEEIPVPSWVEGSLVVDDADREALKEACDTFWDCLTTNTPPAVDGSTDCTETLQTIYAEADEGSQTVLHCQATLERLSQINKDIEELKSIKQEIEAQIKLEMGTYESAKCGRFKVVWKNRQHTTVDTKALRADLPDVVARYTKVSDSRTFTIKEEK